MTDQLVSIIIPVHNAGRYIGDAIRSALNQTWPEKEIIIVDDGSTDNSVAVAEIYQKEQVRIIRQDNRGASAARNTGIAAAKGNYIQFLDADDLLHPEKISSQMRALGGADNLTAVGGTVHFTDGSDPFITTAEFGKNERIDPVYFLLRLLGGDIVEKGHEGMIQPNAWLTPKKLIMQAGPWNEELTLDDDGEFFCRVVLQSKEVLYVRESINYYRKYNASKSLSSGKNEQSMRSQLLSNELKYMHLKGATTDPLVDKVMAKVFKANAVQFYPEHSYLYRVAMNHVKAAGDSNYVPALGGPLVEFIKTLFGWRVAKILAGQFRKTRKTYAIL